MLKANKEQLKTINERWNHLEKSYSIGVHYTGEGSEVTDFEVDDNGRTTMEISIDYLNSQYALRTRYQTRHPRLNQNEIDYLLGNVNKLK